MAGDLNDLVLPVTVAFQGVEDPDWLRLARLIVRAFCEVVENGRSMTTFYVETTRLGITIENLMCTFVLGRQTFLQSCRASGHG